MSTQPVLTKSQIFKAAHKLARKIVSQVGDYLIALKLALKIAHKKAKKIKAEHEAAKSFSDNKEFFNELFTGDAALNQHRR